MRADGQNLGDDNVSIKGFLEGIGFPLRHRHSQVVGHCFISMMNGGQDGDLILTKENGDANVEKDSNSECPTSGPVYDIMADHLDGKTWFHWYSPNAGSWTYHGGKRADCDRCAKPKPNDFTDSAGTVHHTWNGRDYHSGHGADCPICSPASAPDWEGAFGKLIEKIKHELTLAEAAPECSEGYRIALRWAIQQANDCRPVAQGEGAFERLVSWIRHEMAIVPNGGPFSEGYCLSLWLALRRAEALRDEIVSARNTGADHGADGQSDNPTGQ